ncbi:putative transcriptional regulatory protein, LysR family [Bradyrhizobium sp. STM 3843]|uniref:LysR family transcriptional regulator n=1 Tax=Bradyrhizobium sp. STM 3843 TaxID=551947 RepID=UPI00024034B9|nr:LysR family transcriptional regulator [Bradyrhizobium sp. STM 3843]CCE11980.1 putative transcriptional regulatory protein, LysR family [Bradyrhizobium sp. STM 3843]
MLDRLTGLEVMSKIAGTGSLSAAARTLGISQTMVTKHLAALESRLGTKLFHRTTRRLAITDDGRRYLELAERVLGDFEAAEAAVAADRVEPRGLLRLNVPLVFGVRQIAPRLAEFARLHPGVTVDLGLNDRLVDLAEEGWDLAIRIGTLRDSSLIARRLAPCRMVICAAPAYLAAHGTPRSSAELAEHNCLGYTLAQAGAGRWRMGSGNAGVEVTVSGNLRANNGDALLAAAIAGQGIIYQPTFIVADALRSGELVPIRLELPTSDVLAVHAVYLPDRSPSAKVRAFIDFLAGAFAPEPPWDRGLGSRACLIG